MTRTVIAAAVAGIFVLGAPASHAQSIATGNLLVNGGAESGDLTGWTPSTNFNIQTDSGTFDTGINPNDGTFDFVGGHQTTGTPATATLTQTVSLIGNQGITTSIIDSGLTYANVSFYEQGLNQGATSDNADVMITFLDGTSSVISSGQTVAVDSHDGTWELYATSFQIPVGARSIVYTIDFNRVVGTDNDAFVDSAGLNVSGGSNTASAPEPGSAALAVLGVLPLAGGLAARTRRRRRPF